MRKLIGREIELEESGLTMRSRVALVEPHLHGMLLQSNQILIFVPSTKRWGLMSLSLRFVIARENLETLLRYGEVTCYDHIVGTQIVHIVPTGEEVTP